MSYERMLAAIGDAHLKTCVEGTDLLSSDWSAHKT